MSKISASKITKKFYHSATSTNSSTNSKPNNRKPLVWYKTSIDVGDPNVNSHRANLPSFEGLNFEISNLIRCLLKNSDLGADFVKR